MANRSFRISFDPKVSQFTIEIGGTMHLTWTPTKVREKAEDGPTVEVKTLYFPTYGEARKKVSEMGLDQIYDDFTKGTPWQARGTNTPNLPPANP